MLLELGGLTLSETGSSSRPFTDEEIEDQGRESSGPSPGLASVILLCRGHVCACWDGDRWKGINLWASFHGCTEADGAGGHADRVQSAAAPGSQGRLRWVGAHDVSLSSSVYV